MKKVDIIIITVFAVLLIATACFVVVSSGIVYREVETYAFTGTVVDKEIYPIIKTINKNSVITWYYIIYFVDGYEAGQIVVDSDDYNNLNINDFITIKATVKENFKGNEIVYYSKQT